VRALLVLNEKSRRGARDGELVKRTLDECGVECVRDPKARDVEAVIAAGGDGTVVQTLPLAIERGVPLGIVPLGTFNDLAHTLELPMDIAAACEVIKSRRTRAIDLGRVNGVYYVNEASIGLSARIARRQTPDVKQRFGAFGLIAITLQGMRHASTIRVEIEYDGRKERFRTLQLTIANSGRFGGIIERADASIDDGWLDLYSVEVRNWLQAAAVARKVIARDPRSGRGLRTRRSKAFHVLTQHAHRIAADGEPAGVTPAFFEIVPGALDVLVPQL
jgi:YegS/Rv2252/BmrU family lipid kinase